jgi:hypothetical protein
VTAGAGFLLAVLWFDLMHDVLAFGSGRGDVPEPALASIASYYRRVTTDARPMNRLVAAVMLLTLVAVVAQIVGSDVPNPVAWVSLVLLAVPVSIAGSRTVPHAVRLGGGAGTVAERSQLARSILRDHLVCLVGIGALIVVQLAFAR